MYPHLLARCNQWRESRMTADFNPALPKTPKVYEAREKPERGTPLSLIRKPLAEPRMEQVRTKDRSDHDSLAN